MGEKILINKSDIYVKMDSITIGVLISSIFTGVGVILGIFVKYIQKENTSFREIQRNEIQGMKVQMAILKTEHDVLTDKYQTVREENENLKKRVTELEVRNMIFEEENIKLKKQLDAKTLQIEVMRKRK